MNTTPSMTITIDTHTLTITLPDKDSAKVIANRLLVMGARSIDTVSQTDKDACQIFYDNVVADISDDP